MSNNIAYVWIYLSKSMFGVKEIDKTRLASTTIKDQIARLLQHEQNTKRAIEEIANEIRTMDGAKRKKAAFLKPKLTKSRRLRFNLENLIKQRESLDRQLESLQTTQINQNIFKAMRESKEALKSMGIEIVQKDLDGVLHELDDQIYEANQLTNALSNGMDTGEEIDLLHELDLLFADEAGNDMDLLYNDVLPVLHKQQHKTEPQYNNNVGVGQEQSKVPNTAQEKIIETSRVEIEEAEQAPDNTARETTLEVVATL